MAKKNKKVIRYRRPLNINIGLLVFAAIFVYLMFSVYKYMSKEHIQPYEVTEGSIVNDRSYTGIILREEKTEFTDRSGYISYYIREGKKASVGTSIYSIDETGTLAQILEESGMGQSELNPEDLLDIKKRLSSYSVSYNDEKFDTVYDTKYSLEAAVLEYANFNALAEQEALITQLGGKFRQVYSPVSGVISYAVDSYETLEASQITAEVFDRSNYTRAVTKAGHRVDAGSPVYKVVTDDAWSLVFPMTDADISAFGSEENLKVVFRDRNLTANGVFSMIVGADGRTYGKLDFTKYMVQFVSERFLDFEIITSTTEGLKIPVSSVTQKNFFLVPVEFLGKGGDSQEEGFLKEVYSETGTSVVFVPATVYYSTEEYYYLDMDEDEPIKAGDYLVKPDSTERYQVGATASLQGVYNINKGYTVFKQIEILAQNAEFYTVRKGMSYGLNVYDHIVLDASVIEKEGVLIYQ